MLAGLVVAAGTGGQGFDYVGAGLFGEKTDGAIAHRAVGAAEVEGEWTGKVVVIHGFRAHKMGRGTNAPSGSVTAIHIARCGIGMAELPILINVNPSGEFLDEHGI